MGPLAEYTGTKTMLQDSEKCKYCVNVNDGLHHICNCLFCSWSHFIEHVTKTVSFFRQHLLMDTTLLLNLTLLFLFNIVNQYVLIFLPWGEFICSVLLHCLCFQFAINQVIKPQWSLRGISEMLVVAY